MSKVYAMYCTLHLIKFGEAAVEVPEFTADRAGAAQPATFTIAEDEKESGEDEAERGASAAAAAASASAALTSTTGSGDKGDEQGSQGFHSSLGIL